ncbi:MAG: hypothetical protein PVJ27_11475, partial [Candidatus Brocadiaceae bacterium]
MLPSALHSTHFSAGVGLVPLSDRFPLWPVWAVAILAFSILLVISVILLLRREAEAVSSRQTPPVRPGTRHLQHISRLLRSV